MRAFIYSFEGKPWNEECKAAYIGFKNLGIECVLFSTNEELDKRNPEDVVVGGMLIMEHALRQNGIKPDNYNYPEALAKYRGRKIRVIKIKDLWKEELPIFIKPLEEKAAKGVIVYSWKDASEYERFDSEADIMCSEVVNFVSEWRCFIRYGEILGIQLYNGNKNAECNVTIIEEAVKNYKEIPAGCSLDFGVTDDGRTLLVEMNDGFALGNYGLPEEKYAKLLSARWAELNNTKDIFDDRGKG